MVTARRPLAGRLACWASSRARSSWARSSRCKPNLDETVSLVTEPRVLGVQATPAEGAPSASVTFTALVVDDNGPIANAAIAWDFCDARNPLANLGPVSPECLEPGDVNLVPLGSGPVASGAIPAIACRQFGPEVPEVMGNETPGRPVDPDATGGYYQPVSLFIPSSSGETTWPASSTGPASRADSRRARRTWRTTTSRGTTST